MKIIQRSRPMAKRQFRIGELATALSVEKYVIRFWEKEFQLPATRSVGGQRFYTADDMRTFLQIKDLLYNKGFTISGARQQLSQKPSVQAVAFTGVAPARSLAPNRCPNCRKTAVLQQELQQLAIKLHKLQKQLVTQKQGA